MGVDSSRRGRAGVIAAAAMIALALAPEAGAQPADDCARAAWPLDGARAALAAPGVPELDSGASLHLPRAGAVALRLVPLPDAALPHAPTRPPGEPLAGVLRLSVPGPARLWQVTISAPAWVDLFVGGRPLAPEAFTGVRACPGVRKSLRFRLPAGEALLEITDARDAGAGRLIGLTIEDVDNISPPGR